MVAVGYPFICTCKIHSIYDIVKLIDTVYLKG